MSLGIDFPGYVRDLVERDGIPLQPATSLALQEYRANVSLFAELAEFVQATGPFTGRARSSSPPPATRARGQSSGLL